MFVHKCPYCGEELCVQSKFFECDMKTFSKGSKVSNVEDILLEAKEACNCGKHPVIKIVDYTFEGFCADDPIERESIFGILIPKNMSRQEHIDRIMTDHLVEEKKGNIMGFFKTGDAEVKAVYCSCGGEFINGVCNKCGKKPGERRTKDGEEKQEGKRTGQDGNSERDPGSDGKDQG